MTKDGTSQANANGEPGQVQVATVTGFRAETPGANSEAIRNDPVLFQRFLDALESERKRANDLNSKIQSLELKIGKDEKTVVDSKEIDELKVKIASLESLANLGKKYQEQVSVEIQGVVEKIPEAMRFLVPAEGAVSEVDRLETAKKILSGLESLTPTKENEAEPPVRYQHVVSSNDMEHPNQQFSHGHPMPGIGVPRHKISGVPQGSVQFPEIWRQFGYSEQQGAEFLTANTTKRGK